MFLVIEGVNRINQIIEVISFVNVSLLKAYYKFLKKSIKYDI